MPRISFLTINNYLESLAESHVDIKDCYRWNVSEVLNKIRSGLNFPIMLIDAVETQTKGDKTKILHVNSTAFTILDKPKTDGGRINDFDAQNIVLEKCQQICFDMESRIIHDGTLAKTSEGIKSWLYGMVEINSFHHFKVGPLFSDRLFGYRCEVALKSKESPCLDKSIWGDL